MLIEIVHRQIETLPQQTRREMATEVAETDKPVAQANLPRGICVVALMVAVSRQERCPQARARVLRDKCSREPHFAAPPPTANVNRMPHVTLSTRSRSSAVGPGLGWHRRPAGRAAMRIIGLVCTILVVAC